MFNIFEVHFEFHMQMCKTIQKNRGGERASTYLYHTLLELHFHSESNAHRQQHFGAQGYFVGISVGTEKKTHERSIQANKNKEFPQLSEMYGSPERSNGLQLKKTPTNRKTLPKHIKHTHKHSGNGKKTEKE